jgi:hypothetical protein
MADDEYEAGEAASRQIYDDAVKAVADIRTALAPHVSSPEQLDEATHLALKKIADPAGYDEHVSWINQEHAHLRAELARREGERQQRIDKLRAAYHNFEKLPHSREKINYQTALHSMLRRYGARP